MTLGIWITSITVVGHPTRQDSTISFKSGLNIVYGPSNSGKSWVLQCIDYLFGPAVGTLFGAVMDVVKFIIKPDGTFQPAFTLVPIVASVIYGYFLFEKPLKLWRVALSQLIVKIVCNICMNTFLLSVLYGSALGKILPMRALRNLVMWPIDTLVMFVLLTAVDRMLLPLMRREHWL